MQVQYEKRKLIILCIPLLIFFTACDSSKREAEMILLKEKAENGDSLSQFQLAYRLHDKKSYSESLYWFKKSAEAGDPVSQNWVANFYEHGLGVKQNYQTAFFWYLKAARNGDPESQSWVGDAYREGLGIPKNISEAQKWMQKAKISWERVAKLGDEWAQLHLAEIYFTGKGVPKDNIKAYAWYLIAYWENEYNEIPGELKKILAVNDEKIGLKLAKAYKKEYGL